MAEYNYSDINEAKRRVQEMKSRVKERTNDERIGDISSMFSRLASPKDRAMFALILYILNSDSPDNELLMNSLSLIL